MSDSKEITVNANMNRSIESVWEYWTNPTHITQWNAASDDWHTPSSQNDLRTGGRFTCRMEAKDGSMGFDFGGTYTAVDTYKLIAYTMDDRRKVTVHFEEKDGVTTVTETFEAESENPVEMQRQGWQAILDNFKKYVESQTL